MSNQILFAGQSYRNFIETIHSRFTRTTYKNSLSLYLRYRGVNDYEQLLQGDPKIIQSQSRITRHNDQADAANPEIWSSLKRMFKEPHSEQYVFSKLSEYKKNNINPANYMKVIPTPFSTSGAKMLQHTKSLLEDKDNLIVIDKRFDKLLTALRTAVANEYKLDKEQTSYHDILDAFRLSLQLYQRNNK